MKALLVVDVQNDFVPGGSLAVKGGDEIIPLINALMQSGFDFIVASKDWHPSNHASFAANHGKTVGERVTIKGMDQILWPVHCVQNTQGAEFVYGLDKDRLDAIVLKGTDVEIDSYSAFFDNKHLRSTGLDELLKKHGITDLYLVGLATDYCVKFSALDALKLGYRTFVVLDACRGVDLSKNDSQKALNEVQDAGAAIIEAYSLLQKHV